MGILDIFAKLGGLGGGADDPAPAPVPAASPAPPNPNGIAQDIAPDPAAATAEGVSALQDSLHSSQGGIGGFLGKVNGFLNDQNPQTGSSFADRIGLLGAQLQDANEGTDRAKAMQDRIDANLESNQAAAKRQQMLALADKLGMDPREKFLLTYAPAEWAKAYGGVDVPKLVGEGGSYGTQTRSGVTPTGTLPLSPQQQASHDDTDKRISALEDWHDAMLPILRQRANAQTTTAGASATRAKKAKDNAGAGGVAAGFDPSKWKRIR